MKILIAYDGSDSADTAIDGLQRAGLPTENLEAVVVSVGEVWLPPAEHDEVLDDAFPLQAPAGLKEARERAAHVMEEAERLAERASKRVQHIFSGWQVRHEARNGSPGFELLNCARESQADLIVVGSHGRTALGRFVLGSVSQKVLTEASTSVHIGRPNPGTGMSGARILVGVDGSQGALAAVRAVAKRHWTEGSEIRIVVADDMMRGNPIWLLIPPVRKFLDEVRSEVHSQSEQFAMAAAKELREALVSRNMTVSCVIHTGDPKQVLTRHAEEFGADCIFTGSTGFSNRLERVILGSVSAAVAARAHCSVEVVRERQV
ncbi:MAG TPA: universal stress protein [Pyrinomonadaceae bacterium]|nr:universal stress protein [Pyrinomonadaceae bacterium]